MPPKGKAAKAAKAAPAARGPTKRAAAATAAAETAVQPPAKRQRSQAAVPHRARSGGNVQARPRGSKSQHEAAAAVIEEDGIGDDSERSEDGNGESPDYNNQPVSVLREMCRQLGLDDSGRKAELLQRIAAYDQQGSDGSDGHSDGSGGLSDEDSDDGDGKPAAARRPDSPAGWRQTALPAHAKLKWSPQSAMPGRGSAAEVASFDWPCTRKSQAHAGQPPQKRRIHAPQAARLQSRLRPRCSHLRARCLRNRCQTSCSAGCVGTAAMGCSIDWVRSSAAATAMSRPAARQMRSLVARRARSTFAAPSAIVHTCTTTWNSAANAVQPSRKSRDSSRRRATRRRGVRRQRLHLPRQLLPWRLAARNASSAECAHRVPSAGLGLLSLQ